MLNFFQNYKNLFKITGTDAYNFCSIAEGKVDILIEAGLKLYDILPHLSILEKSGAIISDWKGGKIFLKVKLSYQVINIYIKKFLRYFNKK